MMKHPTILVFYQNLRFHDQPLLTHAVQQGEAIIPVFINDPAIINQLGEASQWWLYQSLIDFQQQWMEKFNIALILRTGSSLDVLQQLVRETNAHQIYLGKRYTASEMAIDKKIAEAFKEQSISIQFFNTHLVHEPENIYNQQGSRFQIFTPFWKNFSAHFSSIYTLPTPTSLHGYKQPISSESLASWTWGNTSADWTQKLAKRWQPSENQALKLLQFFVDEKLSKYHLQRDLVASPPFSSQLSPYLRWGQLSIRQVFTEVSQPLQQRPSPKKPVEAFLRELGWREFSYYMLVHHPSMETAPLNKLFQYFSWQDNPLFFKKWQQGITGYPIIDAGMRQLWLEGWIPNRVRMIVASFLIKDLLIDWQHGLAWFADTLVDADPANNSNNWQWVAGCGADAAPYFRIFNPIIQSKKFDPSGTYIKKYAPELKNLPVTHIHQPWEMSSSLQKEYGVKIGIDYPAPIIDHALQRNKALLYWKELKKLRT